MRLSCVTITGADDSVPVKALADLSALYPFVEWGILVSPKNRAGPRFPSFFWLRQLAALVQTSPIPMNLSVHVCGQWARDGARGTTTFQSAWAECLGLFARIQWNIRTDLTPVLPEFRDVLRSLRRPVILQANCQSNTTLARAMRASGLDLALLFDRPGGRGWVPTTWPSPLPDIPCGYAGGLGPETLDHELQRIASVVGDQTVWIDMESRVRSDDDDRLDLTKVARCLDLARPYVEERICR